MEEQTITKEVAEDMAFDLLSAFIGQCGEMAEKNWTTLQVDMLRRLFGAVLKGVDYADWTLDPEEMEER